MQRSNPVVVIVAVALAVGASAPAAAQPADTIFVGDHIVTMDPERPAVEAVAVRDGVIAAAGARGAVLARRGEETRVVELGDRALLPGFIDAHGHFLAVGRGLDTLSLHSPPVGDVTDIDGLVGKIRAWIAERDIPPGGAVVGSGYDDSLLAERRHPTRDDLDRASTRHRIVLTHVSGHLRAANSAALEASGVTADTPDPPGGHIRRRAGSREPDGVLEETAGGLVAGGGPAPTPGELETLARRALEVYAAYGTTTVQDGSTGPGTLRSLRAAAAREPVRGRRRGVPALPDDGRRRGRDLRAGLPRRPPGRRRQVQPRRVAPGAHRLGHRALRGGAAGGAARLPGLRHPRPRRLARRRRRTSSGAGCPSSSTPTATPPST